MRAAFDGAAGGGGPGASSSGGESNPVARKRERDRGRQRQGHDLSFRPRTPGGRSATRRALDQGPQVRAGLSSSEMGCNRRPFRSSWFAVKRAITRSRSAKVSTGRAAWKLPSSAKAGVGGDSSVQRSRGCSWRRSVANVG